MPSFSTQTRIRIRVQLPRPALSARAVLSGLRQGIPKPGFRSTALAAAALGAVVVLNAPLKAPVPGDPSFRMPVPLIEVDVPSPAGALSAVEQRQLDRIVAAAFDVMKPHAKERLSTLSVAEQRQLARIVAIAGHTDVPALRRKVEKALVDLVSAYVHPTDTPQILQKDANGQTVLENLYRLARHTRIERGDTLDVREVLRSLLFEVNEVGEVNQGAKGTCTATAVAHMLALHNGSSGNAAEYARLAVGLLIEGSVTLANSDPIYAIGESFLADPTEKIAGVATRSLPERVLQSAFMQYANPAGTYSPHKDQFTYTDGRPPTTGLTPHQLARLAQGVFDQPMQVVGENTSRLIGPGPWTSQVRPPEARTLQARRAIFDALRTRDTLQTLAGIEAEVNPQDGKLRHHVIVVQNMFGGRVYFDDPNKMALGLNSHQRELRTPGGAIYRVEGATSGLYSMSEASFVERLTNFVAPMR